MHLIVGLGNPGDEYAATRHNIGFLVVDKIARQQRIALKERSFAAKWGKGKVAGVEVALAKPYTFMNRSERAVIPLMRHLGITVAGLIVVHDDLDLEPGRLRIRPHGGSGGHRGVDSIIAALSTDEFARIRVGIGRPRGGVDPIDHVLSEFHDMEVERLGMALNQAAEAVAVIVDEGVEAAMNRFNASRVI